MIFSFIIFGNVHTAGLLPEMTDTGSHELQSHSLLGTDMSSLWYFKKVSACGPVM